LSPTSNKRTKSRIDDSRSVVLGAGLLIVLAASKREVDAIDGLEIREQGAEELPVARAADGV
jgi:hypothetical protein